MPAWTRPRTPPLGPVAWATLVLVGLGGIAPPRVQAQALGQPASTPADAAARVAITKVLTDQTAAWNQGNLDAFLEGYWRSPKVVFLSGGTRNEGFDAMRDRYRKRYQSEGKAMGQLTFPDLEIELLAPDAAFVRGRFRLVMPDGTHPSGLFTLIMRRFDTGWKITHDHTSTAEPDAPAAPASAIPPAPAAPRPRPPSP